MNLSVGGNAPRCGCRRFWNKAGSQRDGRGRSGFCMCEHHACFHDDALEGQLQVSGDITMSVSWDEAAVIDGFARQKVRCDFYSLDDRANFFLGWEREG
jgi:hypothetical protein